MSRVTRKDEHLIKAVKLEDLQSVSGFEDVSLVHNALPETAFKDISLDTRIFDQKISAPLIINAITGGGEIPEKVNEALATVARETGVAMAVGSQTVALEKTDLEQSFRIVRTVNPKGIIIANVGAYSTVDNACRAVEMIRADALQVHLNVPQEIAMKEGDRDFSGYLKNIANIVSRVSVPVIVKEVGFGLSHEVVRRLAGVGVRNFDVGGRGGTNFISIEALRGGMNFSYLESWGITTTASLIEISSVGVAEKIIAAGGIRNPLDIIKALSLGANLVGIAGPYLKVLFEEKASGLIDNIEKTKYQMLKILLMLGIRHPAQLDQVPVVITGKTREWLSERGIVTKNYARRRCELPEN